MARTVKNNSVVKATVENNYSDVTIEQSWSFVNFAKENGMPKFCTYTNKESGEDFDTIVFPDGPEGRIFCHFGKSTQGMGVKDIIKEKDDLRVGLNSNGKYTLYKEDNSGITITLW